MEGNETRKEDLETTADSTDNHPVLPTSGTINARNLIGFWLLGLCNNFPYVVMLSAAFDLLHPDYHDSGDMEQNSTNYTAPLCNPVSTGAILLADILPSLMIKIIAPFLVIKTQIRVIITVAFSFMSLIITSFSVHHWMTFLGVICAALSSGLGEVTFLSYSSFFDKDVVSTWSSGTGGAGVIGALSYASLTALLNPRHTLQILLIVPILLAFTFFVLIDHPSTVKFNCKAAFCTSELEPFLGDTIDLSIKQQVKPRESYSLEQKMQLIKPLLKYMIPLGAVYFAEYFINQGLMELLYFKNASHWLNHKNQYRWYQVDYQVGVLISRSSVNIFQVQKLWILPILQVINLIFLLLQVCYSFLPSIWIVLVVIFYEGLLGGCAYVNTFYKISIEVPEEDKEFSLGVASLGDSIGIALAGAVSLPVHDSLCNLLS